MATPQRQYPPPPEPPRRPELQNFSQGGAGRKVGSGWRFSFWWIWLLVILGIWYVGFGWGNSGGWLWHHSAPGMHNDASITGDGSVILNANNKRQYIGQAFQVDNAPVDRAASNVAFWIGSRNNSVPMLLVTTGVPANAGNENLAHGQSIYAGGRVMAAPNAAQAKQQWSLSDADVAKLEQQGAYIQATQVQRVPR